MIYNPNLKIPLINLGIMGAILGLIVWAYLGLFFLFLAYLPLFLLVSLLYIIFKLTVQFRVEKDALIKRNSITRREKLTRFSDMAHFDVEKGVIIQLKSGDILKMDNAKAVSHLVKNLTAFGIERKIVNRHQRPHLKTHH